MSDEGFVGLAEAINSIREELVRAQVLGVESSLKFQIEPVELTMNLIVARSGKVGVKVGFGSIGAETGVVVDSSTTHTITIRMAPQHVGEGEGGEPGRVLIAGESQEGDPFEGRRVRNSGER